MAEKIVWDESTNDIVWDTPTETTTLPQPQIPQSQGINSPTGGLALGVGAVAGVPLAVKGLPMAGRVVGAIPKVWSDKQGANFAQDVRKEFVAAHTKEVNKFGNSLDTLMQKNPTGNVDMSEIVSDLKDSWKDMPNEAKTLLNKAPYLRDMIKDANVPTAIPLKDSQKIINYLNKGAKHLDVRETINNIKGEQLTNFPEMTDVRANYTKFIQPYKDVKKYFKFNKTLSGIENKFGGPEGMQAVKSVLSESVVKKIGAYRWASALANPSKWIPKALGLGKGVVSGIAYSAPLTVIMDIMSNAVYGVPASRAMEQALGSPQTPEEFRKWQERNIA